MRADHIGLKEREEHMFSNRSSKVFITILLLSIISSPILVHEKITNPVSALVESSTSVQASLTRTPEEVNSRQPALIFAHVQGDFSTIKLSVTITIKVEPSVIGFSRTISEKKLPLVPVPRSPEWYFIVIPGLPTKTIVEPKERRPDITWKVESSVS